MHDIIRQGRFGDTRQVYFHEDDYCQIDIFLIENLKFFLEQAGKIAEFSENHRNGIGWNEMYLREDNPKKISELNIAIEEIREPLQGKLLEHDEVTPYNSWKILYNNNTYAFGEDQGEVIFLETNGDGKLTFLWCSDPTTDFYYLPNHETVD